MGSICRQRRCGDHAQLPLVRARLLRDRAGAGALWQTNRQTARGQALDTACPDPPTRLPGFVDATAPRKTPPSDVIAVASPDILGGAETCRGRRQRLGLYAVDPQDRTAANRSMRDGSCPQVFDAKCADPRARTQQLACHDGKTTTGLQRLPAWRTIHENSRRRPYERF
ncbi:MAG: hypothetical protein AAFP16_12155 [Pseudomonadota bacterium]